MATINFPYGGARTVMRDFNTDLVPASGVKQPDKREERVLFSAYEAVMGGATATAVNWRGTYAGGTTYAALDGVVYSGQAYVSIQGSNTGHQPDTSPLFWALISAGPEADDAANSADDAAVSATASAASASASATSATASATSATASAASATASAASASASATSATASAASATASAASASSAAASDVLAADSAAQAVAAALSVSANGMYDTKAAAVSAIGSISNLQVVEVLADETQGGDLTFYRKESGSLVLKQDLTASMFALVGAGINTVAAADYTVLTGDAGKKIVFTGSASKTLTFGAASGYPSKHANLLINKSSRGWKISPNGLTSDFLWPGQSRWIWNINNTWYMEPPETWLNLSFIFNVDVASGLSTADGLGTGAGALPDVPTAWDRIRDYTSGIATIQCALGQSHAPWGTLIGDKWSSAYRNITILGDPTYASQPIITCVGSDVGAHFRDAPLVSLTGFQVQSAGSGSVGILTSGIAYADLRSMTYGGMPAGTHVQMTERSIVNVTIDQGTGQTKAEKITGGAQVHWSTAGQSQFLVSGDIDLTSSTPDFSGAAFAIVDGQSMMRLSYGSSTAFLNGSIVGPKYILQRHSIVLSNGVTLPGSASSPDATSNYY